MKSENPRDKKEGCCQEQKLRLGSHPPREGKKSHENELGCQGMSWKRRKGATKEESLKKTLKGRGRGEAVKGAEEGKCREAPEALGNQRWKQFSCPKE